MRAIRERSSTPIPHPCPLAIRTITDMAVLLLVARIPPTVAMKAEVTVLMEDNQDLLRTTEWTEATSLTELRAFNLNTY